MNIGIFSGTFDPVHAGHIAFALEAANKAGLDKVYFMPEAVPRRKTSVTHYAHRIAMLKLGLQPYQKLEVLELPDKQFSVSKTMPRIRKLFPDAELHMLVGSDVLTMLTSETAAVQWPGYQTLLNVATLVVGVRTDQELSEAESRLEELQPAGRIILSARPGVSSSAIRRSLMDGKEHGDLLGSLKPYIQKNWLYASIDGVAANNSL